MLTSFNFSSPLSLPGHFTISWHVTSIKLTCVLLHELSGKWKGQLLNFLLPVEVLLLVALLQIATSANRLGYRPKQKTFSSKVKHSVVLISGQVLLLILF